jgi:hypothetical protein
MPPSRKDGRVAPYVCAIPLRCLTSVTFACGRAHHASHFHGSARSCRAAAPRSRHVAETDRHIHARDECGYPRAHRNVPGSHMGTQDWSNLDTYAHLSLSPWGGCYSITNASLRIMSARGRLRSTLSRPLQRQRRNCRGALSPAPMKPIPDKMRAVAAYDRSSRKKSKLRPLNRKSKFT